MSAPVSNNTIRALRRLARRRGDVALETFCNIALDYTLRGDEGRDRARRICEKAVAAEHTYEPARTEKEA